LGFVVGATQPDALRRTRQLAPDRWILGPGIGAQGGDLASAVKAGVNSAGSGLIVPISRTLIQADDPRAAALALRDEINAARQTATNHHPTESVHKELIEQLHQIGCVQFGQFTLASGQQSPFYIDLRRITASPALLQLAARAYTGLLRPLTYQHLAAVPYAALTIGTAVALMTSESLIYPRKEVKAHGTGKSIEGVFANGDSAVIIEDLVTSGGSVLQAVEKLQAANLNVSDAVVLIDREQGGKANLADHGIQLHAVLSLTEILNTLQRSGRISAEKAAEVRSYVGTAQ
jgi:uridine monophosphate synthetase